MIGALIVGSIFIGLLLALFAAPIMIVLNKQTLAKMRTAIEVWEALEPEQKENARYALKKELVALKAKIVTADKDAMAKAADLVNLI